MNRYIPRSTTQWATLAGTSLNNLLNYAGNDKTDTLGARAAVQLAPEKWTLTFNARHQNHRLRHESDREPALFSGAGPFFLTIRSKTAPHRGVT